MNDGNSRFQVNRVGTLESEDTLSPPPEATSPHDGLSPNQYTYVYDTRYHKSLGQLTREALPALDNYRDLLSVHAAPRPTLDELHNATYTEKVCNVFFAIAFLLEGTCLTLPRLCAFLPHKYLKRFMLMPAEDTIMLLLHVSRHNFTYDKTRL